MDHGERGILYPARLPTFERIAAPAELADRVRWFWVPQWDLAPGRVSRQHVIAFPASNLVVEPDLVGLAGPSTRAGFRDLSGRGWSVGALLQPAAVPALTADPGAERDAYRTLDLPALHESVVAAMSARHDPARVQRAVAAFGAWLHEEVPPADADGALANAMAAAVDGDPELVRVEQVAERLHVSVRTLQRLARRFVGVPPAAMIRRRRLQEAAELVRTRPGTDLGVLAAELGYADQAHLAQDFRVTLGFTASGYRAAQAEPDGSVSPSGRSATTS